MPKPVVILLRISTVPFQLCSVLQEAHAALHCLQLCRELISVEMYVVSCAVMYLLASKFEKWWKAPYETSFEPSGNFYLFALHQTM